MVTVTICCQHCGSKDLVRNGYAPNGKQRYRCKTWEVGKVVKIRLQMVIRKNAVKKLSDRIRNARSMRGLTRTFGVSRNTVKVWLKKKQHNSLP